MDWWDRVRWLLDIMGKALIAEVIWIVIVVTVVWFLMKRQGR